ncbi:NADP oxidoreductase, coenzyme F420-dependent [Candidatus Koribacter versatilis Ellin345]|uniref:NADP oxidoreductase, coenzyme F420-dependent n=1 Tax=Koribacter versatilis (strain Ellin345) TaxID=204669 RepID=Q1IVH0_KORVE|nr:NAD(P)-binding domain-containing protein [Candidatus Koribacter versatilis]ABF39130.1 NADP oxidoreductase, coenzyme F420-dependent [Candidatus Koribacter versatilis Ellin345]
MKIGILGSGAVGQTLGSGFLKHGHEVMLGSRDPRKSEVQAWVKANAGAKAGAFAEVAAFGEFLVLATLGVAAEHALEIAGLANLAGKTVMDACNPIAEGTPPQEGVLKFFTGPNESLAETLQQKFPKAHIVKAFNSVGAARMVNPHFEEGVPTMFYCGDDDAAKKQVAKLIQELGWEPFDCGGIIAARAIEPLCMLWCIPGFTRNQWTHAFKLLVK